MRSRIVVIGDAMLDVIVVPLDRVAPTSDTPSRVRISRGGSAANMAVTLAHHHDVTYVGAVGDDEPGAMFTRDLERTGVLARLALVSGPTGVVVALVDQDGQRAMMTDRGVNAELSLRHVRAALAAPFDHLHVSGYTVLDEATRHVASAALEISRERGASTSVDACSVAPLERLGADAFLHAIGRVTMLFANEEEALVLAREGDIDAASQRLARVVDELVITRGANGALVIRGDDHWSARSRDVAVLDTTGAGDAATGAYLAARLRGAACSEALDLAMASAATVVGHLGASS
ncbi:MAG: carbohydrate kinase family protein [Acidimicrobiales bacterium]